MKEIDVLNRTVDSSNNTPNEMLDKLDEKQKELGCLHQERTNNNYFKKKAKWMEKGERATAFFLKLQHRNT